MIFATYGVSDLRATSHPIGRFALTVFKDGHADRLRYVCQELLATEGPFLVYQPLKYKVPPLRLDWLH